MIVRKEIVYLRNRAPYKEKGNKQKKKKTHAKNIEGKWNRSKIDSRLTIDSAFLQAFAFRLVLYFYITKFRRDHEYIVST